MQFQVGESYATRSMADYDCIFAFTIISRTDKSVTIRVHGETVRRGTKVRNGVESFKPHGTYSMCAVIYADDRAIQLAKQAMQEETAQ